MTASKAILFGILFVTLLSSANAICLLGIDIPLAGIVGGLLCGLLPCPEKCTQAKPCLLDSLAILCPANDNRLLSIELGSNRDYYFEVNALDLLGLAVTATGNANIFLNVGPIALTIGGDLNVLGATLNIVSGAVLNILGNVIVGTGSLLTVAGVLNVQGYTQINSGQLKLAGSPSSGSTQTAWVNSHVAATGTPSKPAAIKGNGGINGNVTVAGNATVGTPNTESSVYIAETLAISAGAMFKLAGNVTAQAGVLNSGEIHLEGVISSGVPIKSWLNSPQTVFFSGSPSVPAKLTGNGRIDGDLTLGDHSGVAAGNSPGTVQVSGNMLMYASSFMEIEVEATNSFDRVIVSKVLYRNGALYINFLGTFLPNSNDRVNFASHGNAQGTFTQIVYSNVGDVLAAYSNKSTMFIFDDPQRTSYCSCSIV